MHDEHYEKYDEMAKKIGVDKLKEIIPLTSETIKIALETDEYLNNIPLIKWDRWAGCTGDGKTTFTLINFGIWEYYIKNGFYNSLACRVCLLKHVAKYYMIDK